jgi:DNA-binding Lrp family transcriptional regulator
MTRGGFSSIPTAVLDDESLSGDAKLVLLALSSWAGCTSIYPSQQKIAKIIGKSERQVRYCLTELRDKGLVEWKTVATEKGRLSTYRIVTPWTVVEVPAEQGPAPDAAPPGNGVTGSGTPSRMGPAPHAGKVDKEEVDNKQGEVASLPLPGAASGTTAKRGTRLNPEWLPEPEVRQQIAAECLRVDLKAEHLQFVDYWIAKPGKDGLKLDWTATWRKWMRKAQSTAAARNGNGNGYHRNDPPVPVYQSRPAIPADELPWADR